jgi:hypothetical protein
VLIVRFLIRRRSVGSPHQFRHHRVNCGPRSAGTSCAVARIVRNAIRASPRNSVGDPAPLKRSAWRTSVAHTSSPTDSSPRSTSARPLFNRPYPRGSWCDSRSSYQAIRVLDRFRILVRAWPLFLWPPES